MTQITDKLLECVTLLMVDFDKFNQGFLATVKPEWFTVDTKAENAACSLVQDGTTPMGITLNNWFIFKDKVIELLEDTALNIPMRQRVLHIMEGIRNTGNQYLECLMCIAFIRDTVILSGKPDEYNPLKDNTTVILKFSRLFRENNKHDFYGIDHRDTLRSFFNELAMPKTDLEIESIHLELRGK